MKFLSSSFVKNIDFTVSFLKKMRIKKSVYGTMKPSKIGGGFMNQYNIIVQQLLVYLTKRKQCSLSRLSHKQYYEEFGQYLEENNLILSILVYTFFSRMFDLMLPPVAKHSIVVA